MLFCLTHLACGLAMAAIPAEPQLSNGAERKFDHGTKVQFDHGLKAVRAQAFDDGSVFVELAPMDASAKNDAGPKLAFLVRPTIPGRFHAELREHAGRLLVIWRNVETATVGEAWIVDIEGDRTTFTRVAAVGAIEPGEHPGAIVCYGDPILDPAAAAGGLGRVVQPPGEPRQLMNAREVEFEAQAVAEPVGGARTGEQIIRIP
jgi:hypothetical protein